MADETKRIYDLGDETENDVYFMTDKAGRSDALKTDLQIMAKKTDILPILLAAEYLDFNYIGYNGLNGIYYLSGLGSEISNAFFALVSGATYLMRIKVDNVTNTLHYTNMVVSSTDDPLVINKQASRLGAGWLDALNNGFTVYTQSTFPYVSGIQQVQGLDDQDVVNDTGDWLSTGVTVHLEELSSTSVLRFDSSFLTSGSTGGAQVQFRILENGAELAIGGVIAIGNDTISNSFSFLVTIHSAVSPTDYIVEFKNIGGTITLLGTQKQGSLIVTETYQTAR